VQDEVGKFTVKLTKAFPLNRKIHHLPA